MITIDVSAIKKRLPFDDASEIILVDSKTTKQSEPERNIFLMNKENEVVWQIEMGVESHGVVGYSNVYLGKNDELLAYSSNGVEYTIDSATGRILKKDLVR